MKERKRGCFLWNTVYVASKIWCSLCPHLISIWHS